MSSTAEQIRILQSSAPPESPNRVAEPGDPSLIEELETAARSTVDADTRVQLNSAHPALRSFGSPVIVQVDEDDVYIASDVLGAVYGAGPSESEALAEFYRALDEHLRFLRSHDLHPRLERQLAALERLFPDR